MEHLGRFVTPSVNMLPPLTVTVTQGKTEIKTYRTPAGFRLDQYVHSKYPQETVKVTFPVVADQKRPNILVEVLDDHGKSIENHLGVYDKEE